MTLIQHIEGYVNAAMIADFRVKGFSQGKWAIYAYMTCNYHTPNPPKPYIIAVFDDRKHAVRGLSYLVGILGEGRVKVIVESEIIGNTLI